jgi:hypothetical protein
VTHVLTVEKVLAPEPVVRYLRCVSGRRACPPEDVGGPRGYDGFLEVMGDPNHPEHDERTEWAGGPFDPAAFDLVEVNEAMAWLAWRPLPSSTNRSTKDRLATMVEDHHRHPKGPTHHNIRNDV